MRRRWVVVAVTALLLATRSPSVPAQTALACGLDSPDGVMLYRVYTDDGSPADPPLGLVTPPNSESIPVVVEDPREMIAIPSLCWALVRTSSGGYAVVEGPTGDVRPLSLGDETDLAFHTGSGRWAVFTPNGVWDYDDGRGVLVDLRSGAVTPLIPDEIAGAVDEVSLSPSGDYLVVHMYPHPLVMPTGDWSRAQVIEGGAWSMFYAFNDAGDHLLFTVAETDVSRTLMVRDIQSGSDSVVMRGTPPDDDDSLWLTGWFVPGREDVVLVRHVDRLILMDISSGEGEEITRFSGEFAWIATLAPGGAGALAYGVSQSVDGQSDAETPPPLAYIDFEHGETEWLTGPDGEPLQIVLIGERWVLLSNGESGTPADLFSLDLETGEVSAALNLPNDEAVLTEFARFSADGRMLLVVTQLANDQERGYFIDAQTGAVAQLVDADRVRGSVSPTGAWISYTTLNQTDDGRRMSLELLDVATRSVTPLGPGLDPTWLNGEG